MKRLLVLPILLTFVVALWANPVRPGQWATITLADGTKVRAEYKGDEHLDYMQDMYGDAYIRVPGTDTYEQVDLKQLLSAKKERVKVNNVRRQQRLPLQNSSRQAAYTGKKKGLIVLMQFPDRTFKSGHDQTYFSRMANEVGFTHTEGFKGSVHDYFLAQSNGLFDLTFDVVGPYTSAKGYQYYGADIYNIKDYRADELIKEAVKAAARDVNYADYDWDNDGYVDQVFVLYAGDNQAYYGADPDNIWPHEYRISPLWIGGKYVSTYACGSEMTATSPSGIGTFCHEFTHCLGIPDMYDTDYDDTGGEGFGMGSWDVMSNGADNGNGMTPAGYTSYEKWISGWQTPVEITGEQQIDGMKALSDGGSAYIIYNKGKAQKGINSEYYLLENRQKTGWDAALPGEGLLVIHVDYDESAWKYNAINADPTHQRMTIVPADGKADAATQSGDTYPNNGKTTLSNTSSPAATVYNKNSDGSYFLNMPIYNIKQKDGLISFYAGNNPPIVDNNEPPIDPAGALFYESFDKCEGIGGNDEMWLGDNTGVAEFVADNADWFGILPHGADRCAMFGSTSKVGQAQTPTISLNGKATLAFKVALWNQVSGSLTLSVNPKANATIEQTKWNIGTDGWTTVITTINGNGDFKIGFTPSVRRMFLDEVVVLSNSSTGINAVKSSADSAHRIIYTLSGQYVGTSLQHLPKGVYVVNGMKVVK